MTTSSWKPKWETFHLDEIIHLRNNDMLDGVTGLSGHGVYLFIRRLSPKAAQVAGPVGFTEWLRRQLALPHGVLAANLSTHFTKGELRVELGVSDLSDREDALLDQYALIPDMRGLVRGTLGTLSPVALYCGETAHFATRLCQHLDGSDMWNRIVESGYTASDLSFSVLPFPTVPDPRSSETTEARRLVERLVAQLLLAPFTVRPG